MSTEDIGVNYNAITEYIKSLGFKENDFLKTLRSFAEDNRIPIVTSDVAAFIKVLCKLKQPKSILEIGTAIGYSALLFDDASNHNATITTIEKEYDMAKMATDNIKNAGAEKRIKIFLGDASDVLPTLKSSYDLIFVDGPKGHYIHFLPDIQRILNDGGILISDNVLFRGMVSAEGIVVRRKVTIIKRLREYLTALTSSDIFDTSIIPIGDGVAVSIKGQGKSTI